MIGSLLARQWRHHQRLVLSLSLGLFALELLIVWIGAQIDAGPGFLQLVEQMLPPAMRQLLASQLEMVSMAGAVGFGFQHPAVLVASLALAVAVATIPAHEREIGFLDLLLARPVPRVRYFAATLALLVLTALVLPLALLAGAAAGLALVEVEGEIAWTRYIPSAAGLSTLMLAIGGYTLCWGCSSRRRGPAVAATVGLTVALFWIDLMADMWRAMAPLRWVSPFHYFKPVPAAVVPHTPLENPAVLLALFGVTALLAYRRFNTQDL